MKTLIKLAINIMKSFAMLMLTLIIANTTLHAQESKQRDLSEEDYIGDVPKVLTVSRLSQSSADAAAAVTVIDRETISAYGIVDLPEIFRLVPGFYVGANAGFVYSTDYAVSYHGLNSAYVGSMQVMINGRSVYSPLYGGVNWSELPLAIADIERIEITRGPNAASYGANAFQGTINIITQITDGLSSNRVIATHGNGRNEVFYTHSAKLNALDYRFTAGYRQDDGLRERDDLKRTRFINVQADTTLDLTNAIEIELGLADGTRGEGMIRNIDGDVIGDPFVFLPRTKQINNYFGLVRWQHQISETSDLTVQAYHSYDRSNDSTTSVDLRPIIASLPSRFAPLIAENLVSNAIFIKNEVIQKRTDLETQHTFAWGNKIRAVWGASIRKDTLQAPFYLSSSKTQTFDLKRLFGHVEWQANPKLTFNTGAMIEHNDFTGTDISPRASVNFKLHPDHTLRLGISSALRTANYVEEKFQDKVTINTKIPNPKTLIFQYRANLGNLNPEQIISREVGYMGKFGHFNVDARLFSDLISDVIRETNRTDFTVPSNTFLLNPRSVRFFENSGSAEMNGLEFQAKWRVRSQTNLLLNYAYTHIRQTRSTLKEEYVDAMPRNTLSALITHRFNPKWDGSVVYYQTSKTHMLGDGNDVDLVRRADVRLARQFKNGPVTGEFSAVVENMFNNHYEEFADYNTHKRRARINVLVNF